jgi:hypothetical protein
MVFASGGAVAAWFLAAEPVQQTKTNVDATDLWTREPRKVNTAAQNLARVSARPPLSEPLNTPKRVATSNSGTEEIDPTATGSVEPAMLQEEGSARDTDLVAVAHQEWCARHYRSYDPLDNTYRPYSGGRRVCVSPYVEAVPLSEDQQGKAGQAAETRLFEYAEAEDGMQINSEHVAYCFSRYRSYRPQDNSYQPYGGGQRRQCR